MSELKDIAEALFPLPSAIAGAISGGGKKKVQGSFLHGGKVKKRGLYRLHEGERVLNKKQTKKWEKK